MCSRTKPRRTASLSKPPGPCLVYQYHQQYLVKNPFGYCPLHATGITYDA